MMRGGPDMLVAAIANAVDLSAIGFAALILLAVAAICATRPRS